MSSDGQNGSASLLILSLEVLAPKIRMTEEEKTKANSKYITRDLNEVPSTLAAALDITQKFSAIFGYEINSTKPSLLPLNESMPEAQLTSDIPIVEHFCYSGIQISPNLKTTMTKNTIAS